METKTYSEKLKDPKWQRKRLKILERDGFTCQACHDKENTLHVHHIIYFSDSDPWEYPDKLLTTLCENCHAVIKEENRNLATLIMPHILIHGYDEALDFFCKHLMDNYLNIIIEGHESIKEWNDELTKATNC